MPPFQLPAIAALSLGLFAFAFDAPAEEIQTAHEPDANLSALSTFRFLSQQRTAPDGLADDPVTEEQLRTLLTDNLTSIGLEPASEAPDFFVAFYAKAHLRTKFRAAGYGAYGVVAGVAPKTYEVGTRDGDPPLTEVARTVVGAIRGLSAAGHQ